MYDIIGDVHGHASLLKKLLKVLGYEKTLNGYSHPERRVIFVGDFINRGPEIKQTVEIIRSIVESGNGTAILGNHELNAILYFLKDENGAVLKRKSSQMKMPLVRTLEQFAFDHEALKSHIKWFRTLPLFFESHDLRVVHACWNQSSIELLKSTFHGSRIKRSVLRSAMKNPLISRALETSLKGMELIMPNDLILRDSHGINHRMFRIKWWESPVGKTFREISFGNKFLLPNYTVPQEILTDIEEYSTDNSPVFFGHYCLQQPPIIRPNLCCVDSCVVNTGTLTAYRWDGEKKLDPRKIVWVKNGSVLKDQKDYIYIA
ncbi:MAG: metallophosphoesterase [Bacteroidota bacterium]|nr:metallophosphoesterase [Bacteroidota bacterium]